MCGGPVSDASRVQPATGRPARKLSAPCASRLPASVREATQAAGCGSAPPGAALDWAGQSPLAGLHLPPPFRGLLPEGEERGGMPAPRPDIQPRPPPGEWLLQDVSNAMVALHKEQFGRGPTKAQSHLA